VSFVHKNPLLSIGEDFHMIALRLTAALAVLAAVDAQKDYNFERFTPCEAAWETDPKGDLPCTRSA